jgi:hypothetical protein
MEASQNQSDITNQIGDLNFILAVCTCFIRKCDRFEVNREFRSLKNGGIPFPVDASIAERSDATIQFLVGGLVLHFADIFHLSFFVQKLIKNFMLL